MTSNTPPISPLWNTAQAEDIGAGFRPASQESKKVLLQRAVKQKAIARMLKEPNLSDEERAEWKAERLRRKAGSDRHPFLTGNSPFIYYVLQIDVKAKALKAKLARAPKKTVFDNPLSVPDKSEFAAKLKSNIEDSADFFWRDILPVTNSVFSALKKVDDYSNQVSDEGAGLPVDFIKRKMVDAVNLRIIRHIADKMELSKEERKLMSAEYYAKYKLFG